MTTLFVDYYEVLEIEPQADAAAIKSAYRAKMLRDHVDHHADDPQAAERTILLGEAKAVLLDEYRRRHFDLERSLWLASGRRWSPRSNLPPPSGPAVMVDLRDISLPRLLFSAGVAVVVGGLFMAAKTVADRQSRRRRWS